MRNRLIFWGSTLMLVFSLAGAAARPHDFHVSITEINHNAQRQSLEVTIKIFSDDIERSFRALGAGELRLGDAKELPNADSLLFAYLQNRLTIKVNGKAKSSTWVGKEVELDALWCYFEIKDCADFHALEATNRILTEVFQDQANVMHVTAHGETKSLFLNQSELSGQLNF